MARHKVVSSFVVTLGVLALLVALSLRQARAQADPPSEATTTVANLPVAGLDKAQVAAVHIVNLGRDPNAPAEEFDVMFVDPNGVQIIPAQHCAVGSGKTCTVWLSGKDCPFPKGGRCTFRAVIVGAPICPPTPDMGTGEWMANLEAVEASGASRYVAGETGTLRLPTGSCSSVDGPSADEFVGSPDAPEVDAPSPDAPNPDAPSIDAPIDAT